MSTPEELHRRGVDALNRGRHATARRLLEQSRNGVEDPNLLGRIEGSLAYVLSETGEAQAALDLCRAALGRSGLERDTRAVLHQQVGLVEMLRGEGDLAVAAFDEAVGLTDDDNGLGLIHLNRGNVYLFRDDLAPAHADFVESEAAFTRAGDDFAAAKAVHNLGYVRFRQGELVDALRLLDRAGEQFLAQGGPAIQAMWQQDRAEVLLAAGLREDGVAALQAAAAAYGRRQLYQRRGEAELALARAAALHEPTLARASARRARKLFERATAASWAALARAEELAAEVALGRATGALEDGDALAAELEQHRLGGPALDVRLRVAQALVEHGDAEAARQRLRTLRVPRAAPLAVRLADRDVRAAASARRSAALGHVRAGLDELHAWQSSFGSLDLQTNVVGHGVRLAVRGLALAAQSRSDVVLLEWSERARMLASRVQPVRAPQEPQTVADLAELRAGPPPEREAVLRRRIREQAWQRKGSGAVASPAALDELQAGLGAGTALVAYVVTADRVVALVVTSAGTARHELGPRSALDRLLGGLLPDLDMSAADGLPASLAASVRETLAVRLSGVAELLVAPLLPDLADRRVVLTPSGLLAGVPWTLLPGLVGRPLTVAQSATSWLARSATPLRLASAGLVAGPRVTRAEMEVRASAQVWAAAEVLVGADATAPAVSRLAGEVDVLHVAAHGRHSAENPLFSGLELVDGTWYGYDVDQLPAVPDVVLLSACEVGRSSVRWGEELIGMTAAWLHAGARCVVASSAAVNDAAAHDALVRVHAALATGADPATALAGTVSAVTADTAPVPLLCFG